MTICLGTEIIKSDMLTLERENVNQTEELQGAPPTCLKYFR